MSSRFSLLCGQPLVQLVAHLHIDDARLLPILSTAQRNALQNATPDIHLNPHPIDPFDACKWTAEEINSIHETGYFRVASVCLTGGTDLSTLVGRTSIRQLSISCSRLINVSGLEGFTRLGMLDLSFCRRLVDLVSFGRLHFPPLVGLARLLSTQGGVRLGTVLQVTHT